MPKVEKTTSKPTTAQMAEHVLTHTKAKGSVQFYTTRKRNILVKFNDETSNYWIKDLDDENKNILLGGTPAETKTKLMELV